LEELMSIPRQSIHAVPDPVDVVEPASDEAQAVPEFAPAPPPGLISDRDVRAKRPAAMSFLLRWETARRSTSPASSWRSSPRCC
jgi:hypothetical protein